jgi:hypothetical protein
VRLPVTNSGFNPASPTSFRQRIEDNTIMLSPGIIRPQFKAWRRQF